MVSAMSLESSAAGRIPSRCGGRESYFMKYYIAFFLLLITPQALADGIPRANPVRYSGVLYLNGQPHSGSTAFELRLYGDIALSSTACPVVRLTTQVTNGAFRIALSADCVAAIRANSDLWLQLQVTPSGGAAVFLPVEKLSAAPYAVEADRAVTAETAARVTGADRVIKVVPNRISRTFQPGWNFIEAGLGAIIPASMSNCFAIGLELPPNPASDFELHSNTAPVGGDPRAQFVRARNTDDWVVRFSARNVAANAVSATFEIGIVMSCPN